jgi:hypothetical protein
MEDVSSVPRPPLDGLIDDLYYLEGAPPYALLTLPPLPSALLIVNLETPFRIRGGTDVEAAAYADGCVVTMPTRALEFGYPRRTRSVGVHFKPWGLAPFLPMPAAELCDRPVTVEQVWGRPAIAEFETLMGAGGGWSACGRAPVRSWRAEAQPGTRSRGWGGCGHRAGSTTLVRRAPSMVTAWATARTWSCALARVGS